MPVDPEWIPYPEDFQHGFQKCLAYLACDGFDCQRMIKEVLY